MKLIAKFFLIVGILFWLVFFAIDLFKLVSMNGIVNVFPVETVDLNILEVNKDSSHVVIDYTYSIDNTDYKDNYKMVQSYYASCNVDTIIVKRSVLFPQVSYIEGIPLKERQAKIGLIISSFFLLFLILIWRYSNKEKWAKTYEEVGNRPWLYPDDKTIKNPWKRLKNRLFQK